MFRNNNFVGWASIRENHTYYYIHTYIFTVNFLPWLRPNYKRTLHDCIIISLRAAEMSWILCRRITTLAVHCSNSRYFTSRISCYYITPLYCHDVRNIVPRCTNINFWDYNNNSLSIITNACLYNNNRHVNNIIWFKVTIYFIIILYWTISFFETICVHVSLWKLRIRHIQVCLILWRCREGGDNQSMSILRAHV